MKTFPEYTGFSYEAASREGQRLIQHANRAQHWFDIVDRLVALKQIMNDQFDKVF